jgi:hypothetical protein
MPPHCASTSIDQRKQRPLAGISTQRIRGVDGDQLLIDQKSRTSSRWRSKRFDGEGYQVLGVRASDPCSISGAIKDLT